MKKDCKVMTSRRKRVIKFVSITAFVCAFLAQLILQVIHEVILKVYAKNIARAKIGINIQLGLMLITAAFVFFLEVKLMVLEDLHLNKTNKMPGLFCIFTIMLALPLIGQISYTFNFWSTPAHIRQGLSLVGFFIGLALCLLGVQLFLQRLFTEVNKDFGHEGDLVVPTSVPECKAAIKILISETRAEIELSRKGSNQSDRPTHVELSDGRIASFKNTSNGMVIDIKDRI